MSVHIALLRLMAALGTGPRIPPRLLCRADDVFPTWVIALGRGGRVYLLRHDPFTLAIRDIVTAMALPHQAARECLTPRTPTP